MARIDINEIIIGFVFIIIALVYIFPELPHKQDKNHNLLTDPSLNQARPDERSDNGEEPDSDQEFRIGEFSAYTSTPKETDSTPYITADGTDLKTFPKCVVANNFFPFGTKIEIANWGTCEVRDRMDSRYGKHHFDIYFGNDLKRALEFGRQKLEYIIIS
jgi:3D (Asp-Asp-Asp) domain-containing protein